MRPELVRAASLYVLAWLFVQAPVSSSGLYLKGKASDGGGGGKRICGERLFRRLKNKCGGEDAFPDSMWSEGFSRVCCRRPRCVRRRERDCQKWRTILLSMSSPASTSTGGEQTWVRSNRGGGHADAGASSSLSAALTELTRTLTSLALLLLTKVAASRKHMCQEDFQTAEAKTGVRIPVTTPTPKSPLAGGLNSGRSRVFSSSSSSSPLLPSSSSLLIPADGAKFDFLRGRTTAQGSGGRHISRGGRRRKTTTWRRKRQIRSDRSSAFSSSSSSSLIPYNSTSDYVASASAGGSASFLSSKK